MISAYHSVSLKILKRALEIKGIFPKKIGNAMGYIRQYIFCSSTFVYKLCYTVWQKHFQWGYLTVLCMKHGTVLQALTWSICAYQ